MKLRLVFTALGPLTLSLLFAAHSPPAHAADVTVVGTPGVDGAPGTDGGPGGNAIAITPANTDSSNTANATGGNGGSGGAGANGGVGGNAAATAATSAARPALREPCRPSAPGCLELVRPRQSDFGSPLIANAIGMVGVDVLAASAAGSPPQQRPRPQAPWGVSGKSRGPPGGEGRRRHRGGGHRVWLP